LARSIIKDFSFQAASAGAIAGLVGFGGSFAVVLAGLTAVGASPAQVSSGLLAAALAMGIASVVFGAVTRLPMAAAWSTPGAALLVTTGAVAGGFEAAVGAFIISGTLIIVVGYWKTFGRLVSKIPATIASAMMAGVLLGLCLAPIKAVATVPEAALPVILVWAVVARFYRLMAVPAAVVAAVIVVVFQGEPIEFTSLWPDAVLITPVFNWAAVIGIALPLFVVTMASQNIPGVAALVAQGYKPSAGKPIAFTGLLSVFAAPFGGHAANLPAIVATMCASPDAHPDPDRRYWAANFKGLVSIALALLSGLVIAVVQAAPPLLIETVAGLALLSPLAASLRIAMDDENHREAAIVTFVVAASGLTIAGIGGAFWGLIAGGAIMGLKLWVRKVS
jgi:benzoate membrane transport protein